MYNKLPGLEADGWPWGLTHKVSLGQRDRRKKVLVTDTCQHGPRLVSWVETLRGTSPCTQASWGKCELPSGCHLQAVW